MQGSGTGGASPQVGNCWKMDVRGVMRLEPTVLIGSVPFAPETVASILKEPVAFLAINLRSLADIEADIRMPGPCSRRRIRARGAATRVHRRCLNRARRRRVRRQRRGGWTTRSAATSRSAARGAPAGRSRRSRRVRRGSLRPAGDAVVDLWQRDGPIGGDRAGARGNCSPRPSD